MRLPPAVRHPLMRRFFSFDPARCDAIEVRPARTGDEYRQAFRLVHDAYYAGHFFDGGNNPRAHAAGALFYPQAALPTSTVLVALDGDRIVGTATVIRDSAMGLAADSLIGDQKTGLVSRGERISEFSMVAVAPSHRQGGRVLFAMVRYVALFSTEYEHTDLGVCTTQAVMADALVGLMLFRPLTSHFAHPKAGVRTMGACIDYRTVEAEARRAYGGAPLHRNMPRFVFDEGRARVRFPRTPWFTTLMPKLSADEFRVAFGSPEDLHEDTTPERLLVLRNAFSPAMRAVLSEWLPAGPRPDRETRYDAFLAAAVRGGAGTVVQVSEHGALLATDVPLRVGDDVALDVTLAPDRVSTVRGRVVRAQKTRQYAVALASTDTTWTEYLGFLERWLWSREQDPEPARS